VVSEPCEGLAGVLEARFELLQRIDSPGQCPSQAAGALLHGAWLPDAGEHRLDGTLIHGSPPVEVVDGASPRIARAIGVSAAEREIDALAGRPVSWSAGPVPGWLSQRAISAAAASS
jgi:hypothetical protein